MKGADAYILAHVRAQFGNAPPARLGVAVSGGGDSMALLHILSRCFDSQDVGLFAVTVDHGLRPESAHEARNVAAFADRLGIKHTTLHWENWDGTGNLQDQARRARYELMSEWAKKQEIAIIALGHTADDQAETLLMRLVRSSGVDGLAGMPLRRTLYGIGILRPLLELTRQELRDYLISHEIPWSEDPSNQDTRFDRIKAREAMKVLAPLGLTAKSLASVARNMSQAREALDWYCFLTARDIARVDGGAVVFDLRQFRALPEEIARRLLVRAIGWVGGTDRNPRRVPMTLALDSVRAGRPVTLGGCLVMRHNQSIWVCREYNSVRLERNPANAVWDGRWRLFGPAEPGLEVRALGRDGLEECPEWRASGRPVAVTMASPAVWAGDRLVAAPLAGKAAGWRAQLTAGEEEFFASLLSH